MLYSEYTSFIKKNPQQVCNKIKLLHKNIITPSALKLYDEDTPSKIVRFSKKLVLNTKGEHITWLGWQLALISYLYGLKDEHGKRKYNECFLFIGKKNGKTTLASILVLYCLLEVFDGTIIIASTEYVQSQIAFNIIKDIIYNTPELYSLVESDDIYINQGTLTILYRPNNTNIKCVSENRIKSLHGKKPNFIFFDEISSYKNRDMINKLRSGINDEDAITIYATTAETNLNNPGKDEYDRANLVLCKPNTAPKYLPFIFELDPKDDYYNEDTWIKANPSIGKVRSISIIRGELKNLSGMPNDEAAYLAYYMNRWSSFGNSGISDDDWNPCLTNAKKYKEYLTPEKLATYPAFAAIDPSKTDDWTAYTICFYIEELKKFYFKHHFFIPYGTLKTKMHTESNMIETWGKKGYMTFCHDGNNAMTIVNEDVALKVKEDYEKYDIRCLVMDINHGKYIKTTLNEMIPKLPVLVFAQDWKKMSTANTLHYKSIKKGDIIDDNPIMNFMRMQVIIFIDKGGNIHYEKPNYKQSTKRIDGIDSSVMSLSTLYDNLDLGKENVKVTRNLSKEELNKLLSIDY